MAETITQLPIDECKDWILHALDTKDQYCTSNISFECFPDVNILTKIKRTTGMDLIKTTRKILHGSNFVDELWFGRPIEQKKLQQWIADLINWSIYSRYRNLN
jgi:hypothetical protein